MNDLPPPVALLVAETVTVDPKTKRLTAHGIFHRIDQCPVRLDFSILAFVTEVTRPVELLAAVLDPVDTLVHCARWSIDRTDPFGVHGLVARSIDVEFPRPGVYRVQVTRDGVAVAEQPFRVGVGVKSIAGD